MEEFVENHEVAGFCNTKGVSTLCNARFITVDEELILVATEDIDKGEEISPYHYNVKAQKALAMKRKAAAAARRAPKEAGRPLPRRKARKA